MAPKDDGVTRIEALQRFGCDPSPVAGWQTRGGLPFNPIGILIHHTASDDTRLSIIVDGVNQGGGKWIPGPLVQGFIEDTPANVCWVVADRRSNHAGTGDPTMLDRMAADLPVDTSPGPDQSNTGSNTLLEGVELEGNGPEDFIRGTYVHTTAVNYAAALCWWYGWNPLTRVAGHKEWTRRKIDPAITMDTFRLDVLNRLQEDTAMAFLPLTPNSPAGEVAWLQNRLNVALDLAIVTNGQWGPDTTAAVALIPDSTPEVVGGNDWARLERLFIDKLAGGGTLPPHSHEGKVTVT